MSAPMNAPTGGRMAGRVALISGGAGGIGRASAAMFAREGAAVVIADRSVTAGRAARDAIVGEGGRCMFVACDVTDETSVRAAVASTLAHFGKLDALFNCAGGSLPADAPVTEVDLSVWQRTMDLDVKGTLLCCRAAIPAIVGCGGGTVVNMSSGSALRGSSRSHVYSAAKGALVSLTRVLAGTYAKDNVRANAICAGRVNTERVRNTYGVPGVAGTVADPMNGNEQVKTYPFWIGEPDDVAHIALFLSSHESRMITGAAIAADGGRSAY